MANIIDLVKNNSVTILKIGGMGLTIVGGILTGIAGDKQQKVDIAKAVEEATKSIE